MDSKLDYFMITADVILCAVIILICFVSIVSSESSPIIAFQVPNTAQFTISLFNLSAERLEGNTICISGACFDAWPNGTGFSGNTTADIEAAINTSLKDFDIHTNISKAYGNVSCSLISGGTDTDFCVDAVGAGSSWEYADHFDQALNETSDVVHDNVTASSNLFVRSNPVLLDVGCAFRSDGTNSYLYCYDWGTSGHMPLTIGNDAMVVDDSASHITINSNITGNAASFTNLTTGSMILGGAIRTTWPTSGGNTSAELIAAVNNTNINVSIWNNLKTAPASWTADTYNSSFDLSAFNVLYRYFNFSYLIGWNNLTAFPTNCTMGKAASGIGSGLTCIAVGNTTSETISAVNNTNINVSIWNNLKTAPASWTTDLWNTTAQMLGVTNNSIHWNASIHTFDMLKSLSGPNITANSTCIIIMAATSRMEIC